MAYLQETKDSIKAKLYGYFQASGFNNLVAGTPEHALWNILTDNLYDLYSTLHSRYNTGLPFNASGNDLDLWANFFGNPRTISTYTQDLKLTNVYFYITTGVARNDVSANPIIIPQGTLISSNGTDKFFLTTEQVTLTNDGSVTDTKVFVPVRAREQGGGSNVNSAELNSHNLDTVLGSNIGRYIEVSNKLPIQTGSFTQTDTELQESLQDIFGKRLGTNNSSILDQILDLPGVSDCSIMPGDKGTGTFTAFIDSTAPVVSTALISQVQNIINAQQALGIRGYIKYPDYKAVQLKFEVVFKDGIDLNTGLNTIQSDTEELIMNTINNLPRGGSLNPATLNRIVLDNAIVLDARILEFHIGDYSLMDETIHNKEMVLATTKTLAPSEKWLTTTNLIDYCGVNV